jgi:hypothetical protein
MESCLPHTRRIIWTNGDVLRSHQFTRHLPNDDEHHILKRSDARMAIGLYEWYRYPYEKTTEWNRRTTLTETPRTHSPSPRQVRKTQSIPQARKMRICQRRNRVPRSYYQEEQDTHGPRKTKRDCRLASTTKSDGSTTIPRIYRLLLIFCTKLLKDSPTTTWSHEERSSLALGMTPIWRFWRTEDKNVLQPSANPIGLREEVLSPNRCIGLWHGCRTLAIGKEPTLHL